MYGTSIRPEDKATQAGWAVPVVLSLDIPYDAANVRNGVARWVAPAFGYVHGGTVSVGLTGTAAGPTLINVRNSTPAVDLDLFAAGNRPSIAQGGANTSNHVAFAAADMQNRNFNAEDVLELDIDALATNAAGITVTLMVVLGKHTTDVDLPIT